MEVLRLPVRGSAETNGVPHHASPHPASCICAGSSIMPELSHAGMPANLVEGMTSSQFS
jgi:hypothetical protein